MHSCYTDFIPQYCQVMDYYVNCLSIIIAFVHWHKYKIICYCTMLITAQNVKKRHQHIFFYSICMIRSACSVDKDKNVRKIWINYQTINKTQYNNRNKSESVNGNK